MRSLELTWELPEAVKALPKGAAMIGGQVAILGREWLESVDRVTTEQEPDHEDLINYLAVLPRDGKSFTMTPAMADVVLMRGSKTQPFMFDAGSRQSLLIGPDNPQVALPVEIKEGDLVVFSMWIGLKRGEDTVCGEKLIGCTFVPPFPVPKVDSVGISFS